MSNKPFNTLDYITNEFGKDARVTTYQTGYRTLDAESGGLFGGLYILAGMPSVGKTSFALQMAHQIAMDGHDVLFFSMEESKYELLTKSLSWALWLKNAKTEMKPKNQVKEILGSEEMLAEAKEAYKELVGDRVSIIEGNYDCDIVYISKTISEFIEFNDSKPVVIVDYLQVLEADNCKSNFDTKGTVDRAVSELKRVSRKYNIPVIAIASLNRTGYLLPFDFSSLKESGNIEYTADVVWGLQFDCTEDFEKRDDIGSKWGRIKHAKDKNPRPVQLVCIKNRFGAANYTVDLYHYAGNAVFYCPESKKEREARLGEENDLAWRFRMLKADVESAKTRRTKTTKKSSKSKVV